VAEEVADLKRRLLVLVCLVANELRVRVTPLSQVVTQ